jgi:acetyl esterase/lipase
MVETMTPSVVLPSSSRDSNKSPRTQSAGAYLSAYTLFDILRMHPDVTFDAILLSYGGFDLSFLPSIYTVLNPPFISLKSMTWFVNSYLPTVAETQAKDPGSDTTSNLLKNPTVSPMYVRLEDFRSRLPPALFLCGTDDLLLEDTVLMSARWQIAGAQAVVRFFAGAPHGITESAPEAADCNAGARDFIREFLSIVTKGW